MGEKKLPVWEIINLEMKNKSNLPNLSATVLMLQTAMHLLRCKMYTVYAK